ncbi:VanW family protein [Deinococcus petrolearius]|uniref:VanW family protein n=1 Tax=Deinococcus petrolearius TaxID=1751295 RepID=A0ABW1DQN8_9DEIO
MTGAMRYGLGGVAALALLGGALAMGVATQDNGTLAPGLTVGGVDVGGLSTEAALRALREKGAQGAQVTVTAADRTWTVPAEKLGWQVDADASLRPAQQLSQGRGVVEKLQGALGQPATRDFPLVVKVDPGAARAALKALTGGLNTQPRPATVGFDAGTRRYAVLTRDTPGRKVNLDAAVGAYVADPSQKALKVPVAEWKANTSAEKLQAYADRGNRLMRPLGVTLQGTARAATLTALQVADLFWVRPEGLVLDDKTIGAAFARLSSALDQPAQNARYAQQGSKLVRVSEKAGRVTDRAAALAAFREAITDPESRSVVFVSKVSRPTLTASALPDPAKLELITTGRSTYHGSSAERRANVANAAAKIDGAVVPAGEVFSFLQSLGSITPENGFVGGLIISGGRTVDGLGGGVCQVSTTTFRALYQAGLPVVERSQHSYRVGYYEPHVGFEAAVYDPGVDLKMKNDTGAPLLIRTVNNDARSTLEVQVWGTRPGRSVSVSGATILARTPHPAAQYVVNPRLRPGTTKQVDWAADGYNLYITRTIKDAAGTRTDKVSTVYKPWRAVYEVGPS